MLSCEERRSRTKRLPICLWQYIWTVRGTPSWTYFDDVCLEVIESTSVCHLWLISITMTWKHHLHRDQEHRGLISELSHQESVIHHSHGKSKHLSIRDFLFSTIVMEWMAMSGTSDLLWTRKAQYSLQEGYWNEVSNSGNQSSLLSNWSWLWCPILFAQLKEWAAFCPPDNCFVHSHLSTHSPRSRGVFL